MINATKRMSFLAIPIISMGRLRIRSRLLTENTVLDSFGNRVMASRLYGPWPRLKLVTAYGPQRFSVFFFAWGVLEVDNANITLVEVSSQGADTFE